MNNITISCIIPCSEKDIKSQKLSELIDSIKSQNFPQEQIEILTITEGDSESAKGIGIERAKGKYCLMLCADNQIMDKNFFSKALYLFDNYPDFDAVYPGWYYYEKNDNILNRYFSLIGGNDPVCYFLGKNDRMPYYEGLRRRTNYQPSYGCNGFFYRSEAIKKTNLKDYYPMDNAMEVPGEKHLMLSNAIWHKTSDGLMSFLTKRYKYARDLFCDRKNRRWKIIDTTADRINLVFFVISTLSVIPCLAFSIKGYSKIKDTAWFMHFPVCLGLSITYGLLTIRNIFKHGRLFQCPQKSAS